MTYHQCKDALELFFTLPHRLIVTPHRWQPLRGRYHHRAADDGGEKTIQLGNIQNPLIRVFGVFVISVLGDTVQQELIEAFDFSYRLFHLSGPLTEGEGIVSGLCGVGGDDVRNLKSLNAKILNITNSYARTTFTAE